MRPYQKKQVATTSKHRRIWLITAAAVVLLGGTIAVLELTDTTHFFHDNIVTAPVKPGRTAGQETKGESSESIQKTDTQRKTGTDDPAKVTKDKNSEPAGTTTELKAPSGTFVSNHRPNLSGSPAPNTIQSVCVTSSGAMCTITFTKDGITKSLPLQDTDRGGASYWTWKLQDIGLSAGTWTIQAKATMNGQTKTANDSISLEVAQ